MATTKRKRIGRPPTGLGIPVNVRMPDDLLAAIDREVQRITRERPGVGVISRADAVREVLGRALLGSKGAK